MRSTTTISFALVLMIVSLLAFAGCSRPAGPLTLPVKGKVTFVRGGTPKALADRQGIIEFVSVDQPGVVAYGDIQDDGSFSLSSVHNGVGKVGVVPGAYRVRFKLDDTAQQFVAPEFLQLDRTPITVSVPNENLEVKVWR